MSENGPREGARDLPKRVPSSRPPTARFVEAMSRHHRVRLTFVRDRLAAGLSPEEVASLYNDSFPQERPMTAEEVRKAAARR